MNELRIHIAAGHPAFAGHFPGMPITPGVVLLDEAMTAIAADAGLSLARCKINSLKFLTPVAPDTRLLLQYEIKTNGGITFALYEQDGGRRTVATGTFSI